LEARSGIRQIHRDTWTWKMMELLEKLLIVINLV